MLRRFGQMLAILAVVASVLNAQCALACSLAAHESAPAEKYATVQVPAADHACCPATQNPKRSRTQDHAPCPDSHSATLSAPSESFAPELSVGVAGIMPSPVACAVPRFRTAAQLSTAQFTPALPGLVSSFAVLRI